MTTSLWCPHCRKRCGDANLVGGRYVRVVSAPPVPVVSDTRPLRRRPPVMFRDRTDRDTPPVRWPCPTCSRAVHLDYDLLQRVGRDRKIQAGSMPPDNRIPGR